MSWFDAKRFGLTQEELRSLLPENVSDGETASGPPAVTEAVRNLGAEQAQNVIHAPHTIFSKTIQQKITANSNLAAHFDGVTEINLGSALVNYLILSPSAGGQSLYVSLSSGLDFALVNSIYVPIADMVIPVAGPSIFIPIPARDNWTISAIAWANPDTLTTDFYKIVYGYQPLAHDRRQLE